MSFGKYFQVRTVQPVKVSFDGDIDTLYIRKPKWGTIEKYNEQRGSMRGVLSANDDASVESAVTAMEMPISMRTRGMGYLVSRCWVTDSSGSKLVCTGKVKIEDVDPSICEQLFDHIDAQFGVTSPNTPSGSKQENDS